MAVIKVSQLPADSAATGTDYVLVVDSGGTSKKLSVEKIKEFIISEFNSAINSATVFTGTTAPTNTSSGDVGDIYVNLNTDKIYGCVDGTANAKVWQEMSFVPTNLSVSTSAIAATVASSTGSSGVIPAASTSTAGVLTAADKVILDALAPLSGNVVALQSLATNKDALIALLSQSFLIIE